MFYKHCKVIANCNIAQIIHKQNAIFVYKFLYSLLCSDSFSQHGEYKITSIAASNSENITTFVAQERF